MKKSFFKNLSRDIKKTISRFLSIVIIIAVGVAFYAGVRATSPDMKMSGDLYFKENKLMDFKIVSTLGLTEKDLTEIRKQKGVTKAEGSYSVDAVIQKEKRSIVLNINSLMDEKGMNELQMIKGRKPEGSNEAVVEDKFLEENHLKLNDIIVLQSGNESKIEDRLKNNEFKIVGTASSPLYISAQRQLSSVGNGSVRGFVYILPEVFKSDVFTEIYVRTEGYESENSLLQQDKYNNIAKDIEKELKDLGLIRSEIRYDEVIKSASDKLKEEEDKLNKSKKEASDKFAEGYSKLQEARDKIALGKTELKQKEDLFNKKMEEGKKEITEGKKGIEAGEKEINSKAKEIEAGKPQIVEAKRQLDESERSLKSGKTQAAGNVSSSVSEKVAELKNQIELDPTNSTNNAQYNFLSGIYENNIRGKDFDDMYASLKEAGALEKLKTYFDLEAMKSNFDKSEAQIKLGRESVIKNEKLLQEGEASIKSGRAELEVNKRKISSAEAQLNKARTDGQSKLDEGSKELEAGEKEIDENTEKLKSEEAKVNEDIRKGEEEIARNREKLNEIKKPGWYVLGRTHNIGYETYRQDSDRIDNIGKAFPLIFFLVASLVSLTTMTRMVQENRTEIGTFKALGYSKISIASHYLIYSLAASLLGSIIGLSFGFKLFPALIMNAYSTLYDVPYSVMTFNTKIALQAALLAVLFTVTAAVGAALGELKEVPASLMRPKPPKSGKTIVLERFTFLWKRMSFTRKVTARNIFRYKQRFFMTVIGIAACTGLMITGFGLKEGIIGATEKQFSDIYRYDMQGSLSKAVDETEKIDIKDRMGSDSNIRTVLFAYSKNSTVKKENGGSEDAYVVIPEDRDAFNKYINLTRKGKTLVLDDKGAVITEKFSKLIGKKAGDTFELTLNDKSYTIKISAVTEHYVQHFIYLSPKYYEGITNEKPTYNSFYGLLNNIDVNSEENTSKNLRTISSINSVSFKNSAHFDFSKTVNSINTVVIVLIFSAGVLAFVVIYNLTNININERKRELATIKLLGFYNNELALYIYRENILLTVMGSLFGILVGIILNNYVISTAETNVMMFLRRINGISFFYSVALTITFSIIVNLVMYKRFDKIDMIESLKSAE
jgi:putative ABC transport system permease protein